MTVKQLGYVTAGLLAIGAPMQLTAQVPDAATTTTVEREDEGFDLGWLGLLGLAGLLGLKRRDDHVRPTTTTSNRV